MNFFKFAFPWVFAWREHIHEHPVLVICILNQVYQLLHSFFAVDNHHTLFAVVEVAEYIFVGLLLAKFLLLGIKIFFDAKHIGGETHQLTHIFHASASAEKTCAIVAQCVTCQARNFFPFRSGVAIDYTFVAFVGYFFADVILVIGYKNTFTMTAIFGIQLHGSVKSGAAAGKEVEDGFTIWYSL